MRPRIQRGLPRHSLRLEVHFHRRQGPARESGAWGCREGYSEKGQLGSLGLDSTQRSKYVFVLSIISIVLLGKFSRKKGMEKYENMKCENNETLI